MNSKQVTIFVVLLLAVLAIGVLVMNRPSQPAAESAPAMTEITPTSVTVSGVTPTTSEKMEADKTAVKSFTVTSEGLSFTPKEIRVQEGDTVRITYKNNRGRHDWKLDEFNAATKLLDAGQEETIEFVADKKGTFEYYCSVSGHRRAGMKGAFIVE